MQRQQSGAISSFSLLGIAVLAIALAGGYLFFGRQPQAATRTSIAPAAGPGVQSSEGSPAQDSRIQSPPPATAQVTQRPQTAEEIEDEYVQAADGEARAEAARNLASLDTAAAMDSLLRLFTKARAYTERVAIVGALSDSHAEDNIAAKVAILRAALAKGQVRQVRSVAVDVAAQMDDARAVDLLRQAAKFDPDSQIRELARAALPAE
jgi:hypothetical protein